MTKDTQEPKTWTILIALPDDLKRALAEVAKRKDWSFRKTVKHAVAEYVKRELKA